MNMVRHEAVDRHNTSVLLYGFSQKRNKYGYDFIVSEKLDFTSHAYRKRDIHVAPVVLTRQMMMFLAARYGMLLAAVSGSRRL